MILIRRVVGKSQGHCAPFLGQIDEVGWDCQADNHKQQT